MAPILLKDYWNVKNILYFQFFHVDSSNIFTFALDCNQFETIYIAVNLSVNKKEFQINRLRKKILFKILIFHKV